jgi:hypothetical protein
MREKLLVIRVLFLVMQGWKLVVILRKEERRRRVGDGRILQICRKLRRRHLPILNFHKTAQEERQAKNHLLCIKKLFIYNQIIIFAGENHIINH